MTTPLVTLLSDFGAGSGYPAQMKGALLSRLAGVTIVDLSHEVPHYDLLAGALLLEACVPCFPDHAVHLAVVDPGVGTARRPLCLVDAHGRRFVGPDNGLLTPFLDGARAFEVASLPPPASATFHGRDLFAPAAAWLAAGGQPEEIGPAVRDPVRLAWPRPTCEGATVRGEVLVADPFGNLVTSVRADDLPRPPTQVEVAGRRARWVNFFGQGERGELVALVGSSGRVEVAVREGSAERALGAARGTDVVVRC